jgi:hypothetical protein
MLPDLDAEAPSSAPDRSAATLAILWPSDSATNTDGRPTAVRPRRASGQGRSARSVCRGIQRCRRRSGERAHYGICISASEPPSPTTPQEPAASGIAETLTSRVRDDHPARKQTRTLAGRHPLVLRSAGSTFDPGKRVGGRCCAGAELVAVDVLGWPRVSTFRVCHFPRPPVLTVNLEVESSAQDGVGQLRMP